MDYKKDITMAAIRAYTTIEQSRKLAEILPLETADMYYFTIIRDYPYLQGKIKTITKIMDGSFSSDYDTPCWSLAALLDVLPYPHLEQNYKGKWCCRTEYADTTYLWEADNPVDACVAIIEKLHELKLL